VTTGPEDGAAAGRGQLRAAHADREHVIDLLKTAFVQGRLSKDELDARAGHALTARTYAQLAALTDDIPAGPPTGPTAARLPARSPSGPKWAHPVRNTAIGASSCLTVGFLSFCYGASLDDHTTLVFLWLTLLSLLAAIVVIAYGIASAVAARQSRGQLPPRPGHGLEGQRHGSIGDDPSPPDQRTGQPRADLRAHRSRLGRPRPCGLGVPPPRGIRPAPGAA
jgi:hypothetical protein